MRLVHSRGGDETVLASDVDVADSLLSQARGLMFRRSIPDDYALAFTFDEASRQSVHMVFVPFPIDVLWMVGDEVVAKKRLAPWTGLGWGLADTIIELPAGAAADVEPGDRVELRE